MLGHDALWFDRLRTDLRTHIRNLDAGCRQYSVGGRTLTATMFRVFKFIFHIATLAFTGWLIAAEGVPWEIAVALAVLFISGPEGLEVWLSHQGVIDSDSDGST